MILNAATVFTPEQRSQLRASLLQHAAADTRITGAAITGSAAEDREDRWSDIDLAFGVGNAAELPQVLADWTAHLYRQHQAVHHLDIHAGPWIYRVFLLPGTLQVDLAFVPEAEFLAVAPSFRLVSGSAREPRHAAPPPPSDLMAFAWLYAIHARTSIARKALWQAEYMISGVRDHALALACLRHGLSSVHARGIDQLPALITAPFADSLVRRLDLQELSRAFRAVVDVLINEIRCADEGLSERLESALRLLAATACYPDSQ